jgi:uncharacterized membrane-anchored protein YitT (DUF2179 family)
MPYRIEIYIGGDNNTREISECYLDEIKNWASKVFPEGYTLIKGKGFYNGVSEDSVIICVFSEQELKLNRELTSLKQKLKQNSVLVAKYLVDFEVL